MRAILTLLLLTAGVVAWFLVTPSLVPSVEPAASASPKTQKQRPSAPGPKPAEVHMAEAGSDDAHFLRFPNGNAYPISLRARPTPMLLGKSLDDYDELASMAVEGNGEAAATLWRLLRACKEAYVDSTALEAAIDQMYQTRTLPLGPGVESPDRQPVSNSFDFGRYEQYMRTQSVQCGKHTQERIEDAHIWLVRAVELDHDESLMKYANIIMFENKSADGRPNYPSDAVSVLENAWMRGNVHALHELYQIYWRGSESISKDRIRAYASLYLNTHLRVVQITQSDRQSAFQTRLVSGKLAFLKQHTMTLGLAELDEALILAEQMFRESRECCYGNF